jgi:hypothetical protein
MKFQGRGGFGELGWRGRSARRTEFGKGRAGKRRAKRDLDIKGLKVTVKGRNGGSSSSYLFRVQD